MRYAQARCIRKLNREEDTYTYTGKCCMCQKEVSVTVPVEGVQDYNSGSMIQDAFPKTSLADREFLISGTCGECFQSLFGS